MQEKSKAVSDAGAEIGRAYGKRVWREKTKGPRVIAVPFCLTGLAPPAFTAPCRNQTGDCAGTNRKAHARDVF